MGRINRAQLTSFKGSRINLRVAEQTLREFKSEYPSLKSSSLLAQRTENLKLNHRSKEGKQQQKIKKKLDIIESYR